MTTVISARLLLTPIPGEGLVINEIITNFENPNFGPFFSDKVRLGLVNREGRPLSSR